MVSLLVAFAVAVLALVLLRSKSKGGLLHLIPGPESTSFLAGNILEVSSTFTGIYNATLRWRRQFGDAPILRIKGPLFSGDGYLVSDPAALWKIYDPSAGFIRPPSMKAIGEKILGVGGIVLAEGEPHYRIKRIMQPAFNASHVKNLFPRFRIGAQALVDAWSQVIGAESAEKDNNTGVVDVFDWLGASALDMIGLAAFGMKLGAVSEMQRANGGGESKDSGAGESWYSDLADVYKRLLDAMGSEETAGSVLLRYAPSWLMSLISFGLWASPVKNEMMTTVDEALASAQKAAATLIKERKAALQIGEDETDVDLLGLILKANADSEAKLRLTDSELVAQITTLFFAGHGTSAAFLSWALYHLAHDIPLQERLREEINSRSVRFDDAEERRDINVFSEGEMPLYDAFWKEIMRYYPVVHHNEKMTSVDTVLPLSKPLNLSSGETLKEVILPKGTIIYADIVSYNFDKSIWGEDAEVFNIDRWSSIGKTEGKEQAKKFAPSVYAGLLNFVAGPKACLGWRFLMLEAQIILFELVKNFKFHPDPDGRIVRKRMQMAMVPVIEKQGEMHLAMPLKIERIQD